MDGLPWRDIVVLLHTSMYKVCRVSWQINVFPCLPSSNGAPCTEGLEWTVFVVLPEQQTKAGEQYYFAPLGRPYRRIMEAPNPREARNRSSQRCAKGGGRDIPPARLHFHGNLL